MLTESQNQSLLLILILMLMLKFMPVLRIGTGFALMWQGRAKGDASSGASCSAAAGVVGTSSRSMPPGDAAGPLERVAAGAAGASTAGSGIGPSLRGGRRSSRLSTPTGSKQRSPSPYP